MLAGLECTTGYLDDVIVGGKTKEEHYRNLWVALKRIQEFDFTIREEKCTFRKQQVQYVGHVVDSRGLRPDPSNIEAITKLPSPTDVPGVQSFLGAIKHYGKFVSNMRKLRYPLDNLLKAEVQVDSGVPFGNADLLSRLINQHVKPDENYVIVSVNLEEDLRSVISSYRKMLPLHFAAVAQSTQADPLLRRVYHYVQNGWPQPNWPGPISQWFQSRQESLSVVDGCLMFAKRLVIPSLHRKRCLEQFHRGHPGMQRMEALARSYAYCPSMDTDIIDFVRACQQCASAARSPPHSLPVPWPKPTAPWQRFHVDYAGPVEGKYYLLAVLQMAGDRPDNPCHLSGDSFYSP
ncbi:uncharacterized protein K02A2.6-like [Aedes albopictus]|uniref:RNA-directed DNA polymerase n=1 Tax=Aedes albopictus TaxID=7160 RepID=A0ABM1YF91_AEDAL